MFCPECQMEYEESARQCPNCGLPLVSELTVDPEPEAVLRQRVPVLVTSSRTSILMARSFLEEAGIDFIAMGDGPGGVPTAVREGIVSAGGPVEFLVLPEDLLEARDILTDLIEDEDVLGE
jgi:hypothetical protein